LTEVARAREARKAAFKSETGFNLTFLPFILKATVDALKEYPVLNASIVEKEVHYHRDVHLGIAVALDDGLIVPIIRNAEEKSILGLAKSIADLAERARTKRLTPEEVQGGTFTVTNFGSFGSVFATPIINQPQVAILGVGRAVKRPVVLPDTDAIAVRTMVVLSLSFDHRLIDGATADKFVSRVREMLERGPFPLS
jgi:2-oxoglutarate dehydrogenase E2 component (dihydrolipoamide succinyltransferase)